MINSNLKGASRYSACSSADIEALEKALGHELPLDYRAFLANCNGIQFDELYSLPMIDSFDEEDVIHMTELYGIDPTCRSNDLFDLRNSGIGYAFSERVPSKYLAIGEDTHWNRLCISLEGRDSGNVYVWFPGEPWEKDENVQTIEYLRLVAGNFSLAINKLGTLPEYE